MNVEKAMTPTGCNDSKLYKRTLYLPNSMIPEDAGQPIAYDDHKCYK